MANEASSPVRSFSLLHNAGRNMLETCTRDNEPTNSREIGFFSIKFRIIGEWRLNIAARITCKYAGKKPVGLISLERNVGVC